MSRGLGGSGGFLFRISGEPLSTSWSVLPEGGPKLSQTSSPFVSAFVQHLFFTGWVAFGPNHISTSSVTSCGPTSALLSSPARLQVPRVGIYPADVVDPNLRVEAICCNVDDDRASDERVGENLPVPVVYRIRDETSLYPLGV